MHWKHCKNWIFEDKCTKNTAKAGIFEENVLKHNANLLLQGWSTSSLDGSVANRDMGWLQEHLHNSVAYLYASFCAIAFASLRQSIFEKLFMVELREIIA